ncbi:hypothetical protein, partial [Brevundimonas sp.]|uniref:hypothetical protein n=1 Tax=Brevundimonas sp. TaxID=1871086 RepID=UPI003784BFEE
MRVIILSIAFLFLAFSAQSQVLKSAGVWYFLDVDSMTARPAALPNGTELAYVVGTKKIYRWNRATSAWQEYSSGGLTMPFDSIYFTPSAIEPDTAELKFSTDSETLVFGAGGTTIEIGQKETWYVKNQTGSTIAKGTAVMAVGTLDSSGRILVSPMVSNGTVSAKYLLGVTATSIANGADGYVISFGKLRKTNTNTWNEGDVIYCSATTPGALTNVEPSPPNLRLPIAFVVNKSATVGVLAIRVQTGNELHELHDVDTTGINQGEGLIYNSTSHKWVASAGQLLSGSGITNRIPIFTGSNTLGSSNALYNSTTKRWTWDSPSVLELPMGTDAQRPSPATTSDFWYSMTSNGPEWYNGTRWAKGLESTTNRFATGQIIHTDANQQATGSSTFTQVSNKLTLGVPSGKNPVVDIVTGNGDGTVNESGGLRLRFRANDGNTFFMQMGTSHTARGGSNQGYGYIQSGYWGGAYTNPLFNNPKGGFVGFGSVSSAEWEVSVKNAIGINAPNFPPAL